MNKPSSTETAKLKGIALMTVAMLSIPLVDAIAKSLSQSYSPLFVSWARYVVASAVIVPIALARRGTPIFPRTHLRAHTLRTALLMMSMLAYYVALARVPMATAASAFFLGPIIATALSVPLLGERLTAVKGIAVLLGFVGALVIVQPTGDIQAGVLLALASGFFFGLYMLATRLASQHSEPVQTLAFQCVAGTLMLTPVVAHTIEMPVVSLWPYFLAMGVLSVFTHMLSITAFRYANASTLSPLVYLELLSASVLGFLIFKEVPELNVWIGAAIIIVGGLLLLRREEAPA